jgi:hypothetical protein
VKGKTVVSIEYYLCHIAKLRWQKWVGVKETADKFSPFNPLEEVRAALTHQGFYPSVKVSAEQLPPPPKSTNNDEGGNDEEGSTTDDLDDSNEEEEDDDDEDYFPEGEPDDDDEEERSVVSYDYESDEELDDDI